MQLILCSNPYWLLLTIASITKTTIRTTNIYPAKVKLWGSRCLLYFFHSIISFDLRKTAPRKKKNAAKTARAIINFMVSDQSSFTQQPPGIRVSVVLPNGTQFVNLQRDRKILFPQCRPDKVDLGHFRAECVTWGLDGLDRYFFPFPRIFSSGKATLILPAPRGVGDNRGEDLRFPISSSSGFSSPMRPSSRDGGRLFYSYPKTR